MIAMALVNDPELLIADEPTTALDVTVQAQILDLIRDLQEEFGSAVIMITHDLGVVAELADDVLVMYGGKCIEYGRSTTFPAAPAPVHLGSAQFHAAPGPPCASGCPVKGSPPSLINLPSGCAFHPRCAYAPRTATGPAPRCRELARRRATRSLPPAADERQRICRKRSSRSWRTG